MRILAHLYLNLFIIVSIYLSPISSQEYHVLDFNAVGDGIANDTNAVRAALDAANNSNGGRVIFDYGYTFLTGCFNVTSNVILDVQGTILASNDSNNYVQVQPLPWFGGGPDAQESGKMEWQSIIRSYNADNITITGGGTIDGNGPAWWDCAINGLQNFSHPPCNGISRPNIIRLVDTTNIQIINISLHNSPTWNIHLANTTNVHVKDISITADLTQKFDWFYAMNTDGFDIDCSQNVLVENFYYSAGDDALTVVSGMDWLGRTYGRPSINITIRNMTQSGRDGLLACGGISVGSEMSAGVQNVTFEDITLRDSVGGIHLKTKRGRGGTIENITYNNIHMNNISYGIFLTLKCSWSNNCSLDEGSETNCTATPKMKNIYISNLVYENPPPGGTAWILDGLPESYIENVNFANITMANDTTTMVGRCDDVIGTCDNATVFPYCPACIQQQLPPGNVSFCAAGCVNDGGACVTSADCCSGFCFAQKCQ